MRAAGLAGTTGGVFPHQLGPMTNRSALILALLLIAAITIDVMLYGSQHVIFLSKKFTDLLEWLAFWR